MKVFEIIRENIDNENIQNNNELFNFNKFLNQNTNKIDIDLLNYFLKNDIFLYRGIQGKSNDYFCSFPKENRRSKDTPLLIHEVIQEIFLKNDIKASRSNSFFVTKNIEDADVYGEVYIVLPGKNFYFYMNEKIKDFYSEYMYVSRSVNSFYVFFIEKYFLRYFDDIKKLFSPNFEYYVKNTFNMIYRGFSKYLDFIKFLNYKLEKETLHKSLLIYFNIKNDVDMDDILFSEEIIKKIFKNEMGLEENLKKLEDYIYSVFMNAETEEKVNREEIREKINKFDVYVREKIYNYVLGDFSHMFNNVLKYEYSENKKSEKIDFLKKLIEKDETIKYFENIFINDSVHGKYPEEKNKFLKILKDYNRNEILINGFCCFIKKNLFDKYKNIIKNTK